MLVSRRPAHKAWTSPRHSGCTSHAGSTRWTMPFMYRRALCTSTTLDSGRGWRRTRGRERPNGCRSQSRRTPSGIPSPIPTMRSRLLPNPTPSNMRRGPHHSLRSQHRPLHISGSGGSRPSSLTLLTPPKSHSIKHAKGPAPLASLAAQTPSHQRSLSQPSFVPYAPPSSQIPLHHTCEGARTTRFARSTDPFTSAVAVGAVLRRCRSTLLPNPTPSNMRRGLYHSLRSQHRPLHISGSGWLSSHGGLRPPAVRVSDSRR